MGTGGRHPVVEDQPLVSGIDPYSLKCSLKKLKTNKRRSFNEVTNYSGRMIGYLVITIDVYNTYNFRSLSFDQDFDPPL